MIDFVAPELVTFFLEDGATVLVWSRTATFTPDDLITQGNLYLTLVSAALCTVVPKPPCRRARTSLIRHAQRAKARH